MPNAPQQPYPIDRARPAALHDVSAQWLCTEDDDVALGCECANPALQIERWGQEVLASAPTQR